MRIAVFGTRGFPNVQGGIETHCEQLYPRLARLGCEVTVYARKPYMDAAEQVHKGVKLISLWCPRNKILETIVHSLLAVRRAVRERPDVLHVHAIGPSIVAPIARLCGLRVVVTNHGPDYLRLKWGIAAKTFLRMCEWAGSKAATEIIAISQGIRAWIHKKYHRKAHIIPNGVEIPLPVATREILDRLSLEEGRYILAVGRMVPEKGFAELVEAFQQLGPTSWKLVIAGRADHKDGYERLLREKAGDNSQVVFAGFLTGLPLQELYAHAGLFVLPSYHEGLPIVLLEAMSYGRVCLVSDIEANRAVPLPLEHYFPPGDVACLAERLKHFLDVRYSNEQQAAQIKRVRESFDWDDIARRTLKVYEKAVRG